MSEILTPPEDINHLVGEYRQRLRYYVDSAGIPQSLLQEPDHMMLKAAGPVDFADKVREIKPWTDEAQVAFMELDWRFLAMARLAVPYAVTDSSYADWLEIMEPKSAEGYDYIGVEYASFYFPDLKKAERKLNSRGVSTERILDQSRDWEWLNIVINQSRQEVRITDTKLVEIVEQELEDGSAKLI